MNETTPPLVNLIIHIGPHKTGTTSVQKLLADNTALLREFGFLYPASPVLGGAHHFVPFVLQGWDLGLLGMAPTDPSLLPAETNTAVRCDVQANMEKWLTEAHQLSCHTVVISAEDFSVFTKAEWANFARLLAAAEASTALSFENVTVCLTERDIAQRARSQMAESFKHGLAHEGDEVMAALLAKLSARDNAVAEIPAAFARTVTVQKILYPEPPSGSVFLESWVREVLGNEVLAALPSETLATNVNQRIQSRTQARLLDFNRINTPESEDLFTPFHTLAPASGQQEHDRARRRLAMIVSLLQEREHLEAEAAEVQHGLIAELARARNEAEQARHDLDTVRATLSWRLTKPLRAVKGLLRSR